MHACVLFIYTIFISIICVSKEELTLTESNHSHKKRKDSLETRAILLIFSLELEISEHPSKQQKMMTFVRNCAVKMI